MKNYGMFKAYCRSKLYNILFTRELSRRMRGSGITVNSLHPGFVATHFGDQTTGAGGFVFRILKLLAITPARGAETMIYLASSERVSGITGEYFYKCAPEVPTREAQDDEASKWLWTESERLAHLED
jgi:NAD(P)-dependent dehydrogenase (short-subunit alcohol dehydrogenase family)